MSVMKVDMLMMITAILLQITTIVYLVIDKKPKDDNNPVLDNRKQVKVKTIQKDCSESNTSNFVLIGESLERLCTIEEAHGTGSAFDDVNAMAEAGSDREPATVATDPRVATCDELKPAGRREAT